MIIKKTLNREIIPVTSIHSSICLPGSKYIANRLIPLCALAKTSSCLTNVVDNDDINTAIEGLSQLGYQLKRQDEQLKILPRTKQLTQTSKLYTAHSGTFSRFVSAIASLECVAVSINCSNKMATRPMQEIFDTLKSLQVRVETSNQCLPAIITGPIQGSHCHLDASRSSQYLSALLIIAPLLKQDLTIQLTGELVSRAYVDMTIQLMKKMNVEVLEKENQFIILANQSYQGLNYKIPADPMSASYFMGAVAVAGGQIKIENFDFDSLQGEAKFFQVLEMMGVTTLKQANDLLVTSNGNLNAIEVDMSQMPDAVQTLAAVACFAKGTTKITNIAHLAYKESNRIEDTAREIRKTGIQVESSKDFLIIHGGQPQAAEIETYDDHRMAMSMALLGIKTPRIRIMGAQVVNKSFPTFWDCLEQINIKSKVY